MNMDGEVNDLDAFAVIEGYICMSIGETSDYYYNDNKLKELLSRGDVTEEEVAAITYEITDEIRTKIMDYSTELYNNSKRTLIDFA